jgi:hypothetical protein
MLRETKSPQLVPTRPPWTRNAGSNRRDQSLGRNSLAVVVHFHDDVGSAVDFPTEGSSRTIT